MCLEASKHQRTNQEAHKWCKRQAAGSSWLCIHGRTMCRSESQRGCSVHGLLFGIVLQAVGIACFRACGTCEQGFSLRFVDLHLLNVLACSLSCLVSHVASHAWDDSFHVQDIGFSWFSTLLFRSLPYMYLTYQNHMLPWFCTNPR